VPDLQRARLRVKPDNDTRCAEAVCGALDSACRVYASPALNRCGEFGLCAEPADPEACRTLRRPRRHTL